MIKDLNSKSAFVLDDQELAVNKLDLSSNFGEFSTKGNLKLDGNQSIKSLALSLIGKLSKDGQNELGSYLMLLSQGQLTSNTTNFKAKILAHPFRFLLEK